MFEKKSESGLESIENAPKSWRPKSACINENVSKVNEIVERDAKNTVRDLPRVVGISLSRVQ